MGIGRIAVVSNMVPPARIGGIGAAHFNLYQALRRRGLDVELFAYGCMACASPRTTPFKRGLPPSAWRLVRKSAYVGSRMLSGGKKLPVFAEYIADAVSGLVLWPRILRYKPDIIVVPDHGPVSSMVPRFAQAKVVFVSHHNAARWLDDQLSNSSDATDLRLASRLEQMAVSKARGVICPSTYMRDEFLATYTSHCPVEVIPNIVDGRWLTNVSESELREEWRLSEQTQIVYVPSAGNPIKGAGFVIDIISGLAEQVRLPLAFYLSGEIPSHMMRDFACLCERTKIIAPGAVPYAENIGNIKCCTLCLSPCLAESFGMALLEAQFCGLPVVAFDAGGNRDLVAQGTSGWLITSQDLGSLVGRAAELLNDPCMIREMSANARRVAAERYDSESVLDNYLSFFDRVRPQR